ncbi:MAG: VWA domain-containing protein [Pyrinomonadaceae bacterium]
MRKILQVLVCFSLLGIAVFAQSRNQRPRIVASPTPPVLKGDTSIQTKRPPVLIGDTKTSNQTQTNTNTQEIPVEDDDEVLKIETNLVTIPVSVLDRDGRFISGLEQRDFQIFENNVLQKVDYFASVEQPFTVVLLIDVSPSTQYRIDEIQDAAIAFFNQLRNNDRVVVISFDERVHVLCSPTNNRNVLRNAIRQANFGDGTGLYEAVDYTIHQQLKRIQGRKAIVLFTDGVDTTSQRASYQSTIRDSEELDALVYPIRYDTSGDMRGGGGSGVYYPQKRRQGGGIGGILGDILGGVVIGGNGKGGGGGMGGSRQDYETGRRYLETLARNSGGRFFEARNDLTAAFSGIAEELRRQYSVGYYPEKAGNKGERKQIRVRVMRPNLVVRAKNSYIVGENDKLAGK